MTASFQAAGLQLPKAHAKEALGSHAEMSSVVKTLVRMHTGVRA